ncbi:hypothetical protein AYL99_03769 [Fonsecaea erecta]|uniref:Uncharacterized protein n=1 Tax=Fonsecaea erecta TaxID=1367422 RepID=A0A178ZQC2_9EURO|nr:hypothetical protein AYL99_03769 [Fonsecaea erecta]OAP61566.1 hypothetical protein AYL99_03769 [Fonsecaea erecta]
MRQSRCSSANIEQVGAGTVRVVVANNTEFPLNPFGETSTIVSPDATVLASPQLIPPSSQTGKAGAFQTKPNPSHPLLAISVYETPDPSKVLIFLVVYSPDGNNNIAKSGFYDKSNTTVNAALLKHASENPHLSPTNKFDYIDDNQNQRTLTVTGSISSGLLVKAGFKITSKASA